MNIREEGFLLLTSPLGDPQRHPLTMTQLRELERCVLRSEKPTCDRELLSEDIVALGCREDIAQRVIALLSDRVQLQAYLERGNAAGCIPLTRANKDYPLSVRKCLDLDAPGSIWLKGNLDLLNRPSIALVGSRNLYPANEQFAHEVGMMAAKYGFVLISGNARGADTVAQDSCLSAGGSVISIVADSLITKRPTDRVLYISEDGFDLPFSNHRALSRNRLIHTMAQTVFVAQCSNGTGGTWDGTCRNLRNRWSKVYCIADGSAAAVKLYKQGAIMKKASEIDKILADRRKEIVQNNEQ